MTTYRGITAISLCSLWRRANGDGCIHRLTTSFFKFVIYPLVHSHLLDTWAYLHLLYVPYTLYLELLLTTQNYMLPKEEIACNKFFSKK